MLSPHQHSHAQWPPATGVERFFYSSSAWSTTRKADQPNVVALKEEDALPRHARDGYGWENSSPSACAATSNEDYGSSAASLATTSLRPARHMTGGRERPPRRLPQGYRRQNLRKKHEIEIWGDGQGKPLLQCTSTTVPRHAIMHERSDIREPLPRLRRTRSPHS